MLYCILIEPEGDKANRRIAFVAAYVEALQSDGVFNHLGAHMDKLFDENRLHEA